MEENVQKQKKPVYKKWWFWIIIIVIIGVIAGSQGGDSSMKQTSTSTDQQKQEKITEVDYTILHQEYMDNPIAADAKYKGKILQLTGKVENIDREIAGNTYITFNIGGQYSLENVRITFKKSEETKVAQLKKGQTVTIKGKCTGTLLSTTVALNDCEIVE